MSLICQNCNKESSDDAIFCNHCGQRLKKQIACKNCGELNKQDALYCVKCGRRLDGKTVCRNCDELFEGNFCPYCGWSEIKKIYKTNSNKSEAFFEKLQNGTSLAAEIFACIGALIALIFTFLIGFSISIKSNLGSSLDGVLSLSQNENFWIYSYFGKVYEGVSDIKNSTLKTMTIFNGILGTIITSATFIYVSSAFISLIISFLAKEKGLSNSAFKVIFGYLFGVISLSTLNSAIFNIDIRDGITYYIDIERELNGVTKIGVILVIVFFGISFLLEQISNWKKLSPRKLCVWVCALLSI
jgi:RNA polymerase subunit RPABC4/transcription elongation factor Spt4